MSTQIILVKGIPVEEFDAIKSQIEGGLNSDKDRFCVHYYGKEIEVEVIELSDIDKTPMIINNSYFERCE